MAYLTLTSTALLALAAPLVYSTGLAIYRLFFHPLRGLPGPKLAAATYWYETYYDVFKAPGGQFLYELDRLHAIYGPVIRCSPDEVHIKDPEYVDILWSGPARIRDKWNRTVRANASPGSVGSAGPHALHRSRRAALNPFFSKAAVTQLEQRSIRDKVELLSERIKEWAADDRVLELGTAFTALTLDVISAYCYDDCIDCLHDANLAPLWKKSITTFDHVPIARHFPGFFDAMQRLPPQFLTMLIPTIGFILQRRDIMKAQARRVWQSERDSIVKRDDSEKAQTVFHGVMRSNIAEEEKSAERMADEAFVLIVAGAETTARTMTVIMSYLLEDQKLLNRIRKELDPVANGTLPSVTTLEKIPLMKAVIQEGLRITAPVTNRPILIAPTEDLKVHDFVVPRGTPFSMSFQDILYNPDIFPEPHTFNPDRWIEAEARGERLDRFQVTFGRGTRSCVGLNLAQAEMYLGLAAFITSFDAQLYDFDRERDLTIKRDTFIGSPSFETKGVRVKVQNRVK